MPAKGSYTAKRTRPSRRLAQKVGRAFKGSGRFGAKPRVKKTKPSRRLAQSTGKSFRGRISRKA